MTADETCDLGVLQRWVGRTQTRQDLITARTAAAMAATLDQEGEGLGDGSPLPNLWHWLFFHDVARHSALGVGGHPARGGFLPPVALPRRMWAGGRLTFSQPLRIGHIAERHSEVVSVNGKQGKSGALIFVTVRHTLSQNRATCLVEEHDIVYRDAQQSNPAKNGSASSRGKPAPTEPLWSRSIHANAVMLFRYSALTFNGHRIHYDQPYATEEEGYPGLIVHGPLMATLLCGLAEDERSGEPKSSSSMTSFRFRGLSPVFDTAPFSVNGRPSETSASEFELWIADPAGICCMEATATFA